jgi:hypothetical protein
MMDVKKYCDECKWFEGDKVDLRHARCLHEKSLHLGADDMGLALVSRTIGEASRIYYTAKIERAYESGCGPEGKHWESTEGEKWK